MKSRLCLLPGFSCWIYLWCCENEIQIFIHLLFEIHQAHSNDECYFLLWRDSTKHWFTSWWGAEGITSYGYRQLDGEWPTAFSIYPINSRYHCWRCQRSQSYFALSPFSLPLSLILYLSLSLSLFPLHPHCLTVSFYPLLSPSLLFPLLSPFPVYYLSLPLPLPPSLALSQKGKPSIDVLRAV